MSKYRELSNWYEFERLMENVPSSKTRTPLATWIDYFLWRGGKYSEIKRQITDKSYELSHGGYKFPGELFKLQGVNAGEPQDRSFLGHIAARVIIEDLTVRVGDVLLDSSIKNLTLAEKADLNSQVSNVYSNNLYIFIEGFKGEYRRSKPDIDNTNIDYNQEYLPSKQDVEFAFKQTETESNANVDISIDLVLDRVEDNIKNSGKKLKENWRLITEMNLRIWFE